MNEYVEVSIIIVNYNKFGYLKKCLDSIIQQTFNINYEIIIVDNNSSEKGLEDTIDGIKNVILLKNNKNFGFAVANNQGIDIARGKYCLLLNNDIELVSNAIKESYEFVESQSKREIILGCQLLNSDGSNQESAVSFPSLLNIFTESFFIYKFFSKHRYLNKYYLNHIDIKDPIRVDIIKGAFMFGLKDVFRKVHGFDERFFFYSEETDLCYRLKNELQINIIYCPQIKVYHHNNTESKFKGWFHHKNVSIGKIQYYQKHFKGIKKFIAIFLHHCGNIVRFISNIAIGLLKLEKKYLLKGTYFIKLLFIPIPNKFQ